jgi:deazaflavin-dependent oxidoreductase (nitroreductase family)
MRIVFKLVVGLHVFFYRLTRGRFGGQVGSLRVLLLTTTGAKTGKTHTTALSFFEDDGAYVIVGSNAGFATHPAWFHNLKRNPRAMIEINDKQLPVEAAIAGPDKRRELWARLIELAPGYQAYANRTRREIPIVLLRPPEG